MAHFTAQLLLLLLSKSPALPIKLIRLVICSHFDRRPIRDRCFTVFHMILLISESERPQSAAFFQKILQHRIEINLSCATRNSLCPIQFIAL